jgi:lipid A 3-O-deacylase
MKGQTSMLIFFKKMCAGICFALLLASFPNHAQAQSSHCDLDCVRLCIPQNDIEHIFSKGSMDVGFDIGGAVGLKIFGSHTRHDFILGSVNVGRIISDNKCAGHWYEGNWEVLGELFGGYQLSPKSASFAGLTPFLRYNFVTHTRWVPFVEAGAGVTLTDIYGPDLSTLFEFNLQAGVGVQYFLCQNLALTLETKFMHFSNASIESPNLGVNTAVFLLGFTQYL